ncbi:hypothetical protein CSB37_03270 [bacterium DOLZORAL124_38_8]|nr:MAG: hypothetical protein CSB37_03270 [bacterium DOLZORAL124_38_8]
MSSESIGNLDDLALGNVSEGVSETTPEEIRAKAAAAAQKMQKLRKDEKKAHGFDEALAKIIMDKTIPLKLIQFIAFLIDSEVPSLTILSLIAINNAQAAITCTQHFAKKTEQVTHDQSLDSIGLNDAISHKVDLWWKFIFLADKESTTVRLKDLRTNQRFIEHFPQQLAELFKRYLEKNKASFNKEQLEKILNERGRRLFME